jgi:TIR domain
MPETTQTPYVFISHSRADAGFANEFEQTLLAIKVASWNFNSAIAPGDNYLEKVKPALETCTHIVVLVSPLTRDSRWVDMEMEVAMATRENGPGAGLIGVILPNHDDFKRPYYEPELVPLRSISHRKLESFKRCVPTTYHCL